MFELHNQQDTVPCSADNINLFRLSGGVLEVMYESRMRMGPSITSTSASFDLSAREQDSQDIDVNIVSANLV